MASAAAAAAAAAAFIGHQHGQQRHQSQQAALPDAAIRCTAPSCACDCFLPGKQQLRQCQTCKHGWVPHALDKLGMRSSPLGASFLSNPAAPVEPALPNTVFDVASLALYGCQALPIRLKILLDRLFSVLAPEDVVQVLTGFGWSLEDYARGYILQDNQGRPIDFWSICGRDEEPLVLQQFLRFGETRAIAARILQQHEAESKAHQPPAQPPQHGPPAPSNNNNNPPNPPSSAKPAKEPQHQQVAAPSVPNPHDPFGKMNPDIKKLLEKAQQNPAMLAGMLPGGFNPLGGLPFPFLPGLAPSHLARLPPMMPAPHPAPKTPPNNNNNPTTSSLPSVPSPLNRLQGMQPFDFRAKPPQGPESPHKSPQEPKTSGSPLCLTNKDGQRSTANSSSDSELEWDDDDLLDDEVYEDSASSNALNLTRKTTSSGRPEISDSLDQQRKNQQRSGPGRRGWNPLGPLGTQLINPQTGKKRVQCNVCLKTFCDKGALKIHFSAVHLREMHKCTVDGCNMMFSSRRSRNRHSANPNPKLHSPHLRRKISPHDGRTAQPHPTLGTLISHVQQQGVPFGLAGLPLVHPATAGLLAEQMATASNRNSASSISSGAEMNTAEDKRRGSVYAASSDDLDDEIDDLSSSDEDRNKLPVTSGVRKRKSQNPTRLLVDDDKDDGSDDEEGKRVKSEGDEKAAYTPEASEVVKREREDKEERMERMERMDEEKRLTPSPGEFLSRIYGEGAMAGLAGFAGPGLHPAAAAFLNAAAAAHAAAVASASSANGQVNGHAPPTSGSASPSPPVAVRSSV